MRLAGTADVARAYGRLCLADLPFYQVSWSVRGSVAIGILGGAGWPVSSWARIGLGR